MTASRVHAVSVHAARKASMSAFLGNRLGRQIIVLLGDARRCRERNTVLALFLINKPPVRPKFTRFVAMLTL